MISYFSRKKLWKNRWILLSGLAAICLFAVRPYRIIVEIGAFLLALLLIWGAMWENEARSEKCGLKTIFLAGAIDISLVINFIQAWSPSRKVAALAGMFHLSAWTFLIILGTLGTLVGFRFICFVLSSVFRKVVKTFDITLKTDTKVCLRNLRSNWYIAVSSLFFFYLESKPEILYYVGFVLAFLCTVLISSQKHNIISLFKDEPLTLKFYAALSALGICLAGKRTFYHYREKYQKPVFLVQDTRVLYVLSILAAAAGLIFAYLFIITILGYVRRKIHEANTIRRFSRLEWFIFGGAFIGFAVLTFIVFSKTQAFYRTEYLCDVIYTSDSPCLVNNSADLCILYAENDLRQPLFAVFAAPFTGAPFLIVSMLSKVLPIPDSVFCSILNCMQIALVLAAMILLVDMMNLKKWQRICFFAALCFGYPLMLSSLMIEQYIVAYFWLIFALYTSRAEDKRNVISYCGAAGTLLTSGIIFPMYNTNRPGVNRKEYMLSLFDTGFKAVTVFVLLLVAFGRFDVLYNFSRTIRSLSRFAGNSVTLPDKLLQYLSFVSDCFIAPKAGADAATNTYISWQLNAVEDVNIAGVIIFILSGVSLILNRKDRFSVTTGCWAIFSFLILFVLGWGTAENGLILYSLYFSWAFYVLLFKMLITISERVHVLYLTHIITFALSAVMLYLNISGIRDMISFAITYYPL